MAGVSRYEVGTVLAYGYCLPTGVNTTPSNRKASGFLKLLDVIESDLGGYTAACGSIEAKVLVLPAHARVVELAYTADLKSATVKVCGFKSHL